MKKALILLCSAACIHSWAQNYELRVGVNQGINRVFIGSAAHASRFGHSTSLSLGLVFKSKRSVFRFDPSLAYVYHVYNVRVNKFLSFSYPQSSWCLTLQTGLRVAKHCILKGGFFIQTGVRDNKYKVYVTDRSGIGAYSIGNDELYADYHPTENQAGAQLGLTVTLGEREYVCLDVQIQQHATRVSDTDYYLHHNFANAQRRLLIGSNTKPTVLFAGLTFRINRAKEKRRLREENSEERS